MPETDHNLRFAELRALGEPFVAVTLVDAHGSTPSDAGSKMIVRASGHDHGTVGGGKVEAKAIDLALRMLSSSERTQFVDWSLKADVGMTCGGRVKLFFERVDDAAWRVVVFGAGHVTQALAKLLVQLPCRLTCIDPRHDWLGKLPGGAEAVQADDPPGEVAKLSDDSYVLCMTRGHSADRPVLEQIFRLERRFPYLGVIGSDAKAATLRRELIEDGIDEQQIEFRCPVGLPIGSNHPAEIAVSIAAELLQVRDQAAKSGPPS
ncbi:MAG: xanthine dehydrogenase accessory protein XdhC [Planctomycetota bacterium]